MKIVEHFLHTRGGAGVHTNTTYNTRAWCMVHGLDLCTSRLCIRVRVLWIVDPQTAQTMNYETIN